MRKNNLMNIVKMCTGLVAVLSLSIMLAGCNDSKTTEKENKTTQNTENETSSKVEEESSSVNKVENETDKATSNDTEKSTEKRAQTSDCGSNGTDSDL